MNDSARQARPWISGVVIAFLLCLASGCTEQSDSTSGFRVTLLRCKDGIEPSNQSKCKGGSSDGGVLDFRMYPNEHSILVHVVKDEPGNPRPSLFLLPNCLIWNSRNWHCEDSSSSGSYISVYEAKQGRVVRWYGGIPGDTGTFYIGDVKYAYEYFWDRFK